MWDGIRNRKIEQNSGFSSEVKVSKWSQEEMNSYFGKKGEEKMEITEKAYQELHDQGLKDKTIAERWGVSASSLSQYKRKWRLERPKEDNQDSTPVPKELVDVKQKHLNHPFYKDAQQFWKDTQRQQIIKGSEKYPEPFTTSSWTDDEIIDHAMQENVDQTHYIYAAKERMNQQRKDIIDLEADNQKLRQQLAETGKKIKRQTERLKELETTDKKKLKESLDYLRKVHGI